MKQADRPYFIWDYNINERQIRAILRGNNETEKSWLIARILTHALFKDIWKYIRIKDIVRIFPKLRLPQKIKKSWQHTLGVWGYHVQSTQ